MEHFEFRQPLGGDRESAFVYHSAKRLMFPSLLLARIVYVGLPFSVHSNDLNLPFARLFALAGAGKYAQDIPVTGPAVAAEPLIQPIIT